MTKEEKELTIEYLNQMQNDYIEGYGYEAHPLPEYFALEYAIQTLKEQSCDDCISRKTAIDQFKHWYSDLLSSGKEKILFEDILKTLPPVKPQQEWIPCGERFPKEYICDDGYVEPSDYVLVWGDHGNYGVSRYWGNRKSKIENPNSYKDWMDLDWVVQKPIAWMPLPRPYQKNKQKEK